MKNSLSKEWLLIIGLATFKLVIHLATNTNYELHRDALLYYSLGEHLDWGFVSVPPLTPLISKISLFLFGHNTFALRFFPAVAGAVSVVLVAKIVRELKGGKWAILIAAAAFILSPAFLRSNTLFQPVTFNQFFWLLSAYLLVRLILTSDPKKWLWIFLVWGLAFQNKYSIAFFIIATFLALLLTKHRRLFFSKYFVFGGIIGLLIILPNIAWQHFHNWPLIHHMNELQETQFVHVSISGFLIDQLVMNLPALIIWMTGLIVFLFFKAEKDYRALGFLYLFIILILIVFQGKSYYTLGIYPMLFALGGYAIGKYFHPTLKYAAIGLTLLIAVPLLPFSLPIFSHEKMAEYSKPVAEFTNRWEDGKVHEIPQDYADMTGWKELSAVVSDFYHSLPDSTKSGCLIYAEDYAEAGAIMFYGKKSGLPEPISFSDSFILWAPDSIDNVPVIFINEEPGDAEDLFEEYKVVGQVENKYFRENDLKVFYGSKPKDSLKYFYRQTIRKLKERYD
ncbi:MAG: glycosyltransferase family 39 protein [Bacteroidales bacterium]|nr:glycosyltransferase family 39 protein [Bacteroidales bacterium]MCF8338574.1 glycosyltransferase family 39 protein [Bacteroidales bacterium]